ncbi:hypothetical protein CLF_107843, partial [Clonorchis sinensis]
MIVLIQPNEMHLCVVAILGGLLCSHVLGNLQLDPFQNDQAGHSPNELPLNGETESPAVANADDQNTHPEEEHTGEVNDVALKLSAQSIAGSQEKTKFSLPKKPASNLQGSSIHHAGVFIEPVQGRERNFRKPLERSTADGLSGDMEVKYTPKCPCTYKELKVMLSVMRNAEYVLEDILLFLERSRKLEKTVSNLLKSVDRTLRVHVCKCNCP